MVCELWPEAGRMTCPVCVDADGADVAGAEIDAANAVGGQEANMVREL